MAGEVLQKFSSYRMGLAVVGNFEAYNSKAFMTLFMKVIRPGIPSLQTPRQQP